MSFDHFSFVVWNKVIFFSNTILDGGPTVVVVVVVVVVVLTVDRRNDSVGCQDGGTHEVEHVEGVGLVKLTGGSPLLL